jgi:hypothetical protein
MVSRAAVKQPLIFASAKKLGIGGWHQCQPPSSKKQGFAFWNFSPVTSRLSFTFQKRGDFSGFFATT